MELMVHTGGPHGQGRGGLQTYDYDQNSAHSVEVRRETDENGDLGTFGFTLQYEKPPIVGTIVPGQWNSVRVYESNKDSYSVQ